MQLNYNGHGYDILMNSRESDVLFEILEQHMRVISVYNGLSDETKETFLKQGADLLEQDRPEIDHEEILNIQAEQYSFAHAVLSKYNEKSYGAVDMTEITEPVEKSTDLKDLFSIEYLPVETSFGEATKEDGNGLISEVVSKLLTTHGKNPTRSARFKNIFLFGIKDTTKKEITIYACPNYIINRYKYSKK